MSMEPMPPSSSRQPARAPAARRSSSQKRLRRGDGAQRVLGVRRAEGGCPARAGRRSADQQLRLAGRSEAAIASARRRCSGIVVVRSAEAATMSASISRALARKRSTGTSWPRSWTSKPWAASSTPTSPLPMSWRSPCTVPRTTRPRVSEPARPAASAGSTTAIAAFIASAPCTSSGRKYSPSSQSSPTRRMPAANPCSTAATRSVSEATRASASSRARVASPWTTASRMADSAGAGGIAAG